MTLNVFIWVYIKQNIQNEQIILSQGILEEMYEKQSLLDSTKSGINDLLKRKPTAFGADVLRDELTEVTSRWKSLHDTCKNRWACMFKKEFVYS